jgi:hypothetical protein
MPNDSGLTVHMLKSTWSHSRDAVWRVRAAAGSRWYAGACAGAPPVRLLWRGYSDLFPVLLRCGIDSQGMQGHKQLADSCKTAVQAWRYEPHIAPTLGRPWATSCMLHTSEQ